MNRVNATCMYDGESELEFQVDGRAVAAARPVQSRSVQRRPEHIRRGKPTRPQRHPSPPQQAYAPESRPSVLPPFPRRICHESIRHVLRE